MNYTEKDLLSDKDIRDKISCINVLGDYNKLIEDVTTEFVVSEYFKTDKKVIIDLLLNNLDEFDGSATLCSREEIIEMIKYDEAKLSNLRGIIPNEAYLFKPLALLRIAMLLEDSETAKDLRVKILEDIKRNQIFDSSEEANLMIFEGQNVDIQVIDNEVYFEIYSTGAALGYIKTKKVKDKIYTEIRKDRINKIIENVGISTFPHGGEKYITESQLYDFMLESRTEKCKEFRKWVVEDVFPSIRKHGAYITEKKLEDVLLNPDRMIELCQQLKIEREEKSKAILRNRALGDTIKRKSEEIEEQQIVIDSVIIDEGLMPIGTLGGILGHYSDDLGWIKLFDTLRKLKILKNGFYIDRYGKRKTDVTVHNLPYSTYSKYFEVKFRNPRDGKKQIVPRTYFNAEGIKYILKKLVKEGYLNKNQGRIAESYAMNKINGGCKDVHRRGFAE